MSFKKLNLDRDKIEGALQEATKNIDTDSEYKIKDQTNNKITYTIKINNKIALLEFYFRQNGTTTIHYELGQNHDISLEIAKRIKELTEINPLPNFSFHFDIENTDQVDLLIDFLVKECQSDIINENIVDGHKILRIKGKYNDTITIKIYTNNTVQIQGKPISLYKEIFYFLSEILDKKAITKAQADFFNVEIGLDEREDEFKQIFSFAHRFIDGKLQDIIIPSLSVRKLNIVLPDYTLFVFPMLKGLEGYIKKIFSNCGIIVDNKDGLGKHFIGGRDHKSVLTLDDKSIISNVQICLAIEKAYNYFRQQRHSLFHVDGLITPTRIISSREEAEKIINEIIDIINDTYQMIQSEING